MSTTLLDLVQQILGSLDSDQVNSIEDTIEAEQVAEIIRDCFYDVCSEMDVSFQGELVALQDAATSDFPTRSLIPKMTHGGPAVEVDQIHWIKYVTKESNDGNVILAGAGQLDDEDHVGWNSDDYDQAAFGTLETNVTEWTIGRFTSTADGIFFTIALTLASDGSAPDEDSFTTITVTGGNIETSIVLDADEFINSSTSVGDDGNTYRKWLYFSSGGALEEGETYNFTFS